MAFTDDTECALISAAALANSGGKPDSLTSKEQLAAFFVEYRYMGRFDGDAAELEAVRELRSVLRHLLLSERDTAVDVVNEILAAAPLRPRLVRHGDMDWHLHAIGDDRPLAERIAIETAMAMIDVIRSDELDRIHVCAADCNGVVVDLSRNRSRKFCSVACGNRTAVAAYRTRKARS